MKKSVSQHSEQNPASKAAPAIMPDSPWTEGDISFREGNCNVLLIAPHGRPEDDTNTGKLTRELAELLDCYAVINEKYLKTSTAGVPETDPENSIADLYKQSEAKLPQIKPLFLDVINSFKKEIINNHQSLFIIHVHGIATNNVPKVAKLISEFQKKTKKLQVIIGYGQWRNNKSKPTADLEKTVKPFINRVIEHGLETAVAPTDPIKVNGSDTWYCGWDDDRLNQYLYDPKIPMQSFQIELKEAGVRNKRIHRSKTVKALAAAIKPFLDSADQSGTIQQIQVDEIDPENGQFMSRLDDIASDTVDFKRLVDSIKRHGILNPVIVRKRSDKDGKPYQLISGFRRLTALRASITEKDADGTTVPARVLNNSVTDDEAYQISFTENLARQDLSLWEIAQACAEIKKQKMTEGNMSQGQIDEHLAELIQKDTRTVRRYLKLSSLDNEPLTKAVHTREISPTLALDLGKRDLGADEIESLLDHIKTHPKTTRTFERFYSNLERCCQLSGLSVSEVLNCSNSDKFLSLLQNELINRIEYLVDTHKKLTIPEILQGKAGSLAKEIAQVKAGLGRALQNQRFQKKNAALVKKVTAAFEHSEIDGQFKIKPVTNSSGKHVSVTITAPENQIWQAINAISDIKAKSSSKGSDNSKTIYEGKFTR